MKKLNVVGDKYGRWTVLEEAQPTELKHRRVKCACECGSTVVVTLSDLRQGKSKSCGCLKKEVTSKVMTTHGMSKSVEYRHYAGMIDRCRNPNNKHYRDYGARGITVCNEFTEDFMAFYQDIGPKPVDGKRWSVGRIDNNVGYTVGNIRWELDEQQARNHSLQKNNTSGVAGICIRHTERDGSRIVARYNELDGRRVSKSFSIRIHGSDEAMRLAVEWREGKIKELNAQGADYAESHGSEKVFV